MLPWLRSLGGLDVPDPEWHAAAGILEAKRNVQSPAHVNVDGLTDSEFTALRATTLAVSCVSVVCAILASYFFIRMRRSFRHDLIMVLIQSDAFKAIWFMIYPIVTLSHGPVGSNSAFCQASGFFLSLGIEACDVAVIIVSLHIALYIFRGRNGLYEYRWIAYAAWVTFPLLMASLAFIHNQGYADEGEYCYLPSDPSWPRHALSWIPRYIIFVALILTYAFIYIYVTVLMSRFGAIARIRKESKSTMAPNTLRKAPPAYYSSNTHTYGHELLPSTASSMADSREINNNPQRISDATLSIDLHLAPSTATSTRLLCSTKRQDQSVQWSTPTYGSDAGAPPYLETIDSESIAGDQSVTSSGEQRRVLAPPLATHPSSIAQCDDSSAISPSTARSFWKRPNASMTGPPMRRHSLANAFSNLRRPRRGSGSTSSIFLSRSVVEETGMTRTRDKMRRQLRKLFIYPVVYLVIWILPLICHIVTGVGRHPGFVLHMLRMISLCLSGTLDAVVFCIKEKPWRHPDTTWQMRLGETPRSRTNPNVGRSREEMRIDSKLARKRREVEIAERAHLRLQHPGSPRTGKEWWDVFFNPSEEFYYDESELHEREDV